MSAEDLQGKSWPLASEEEVRLGLEKAFDYRGDVTITQRDGTQLSGYMFDRKSAKTLADSLVRIIPTGTTQRVSLPYTEIAGLVFSGRDTAAGKSWEAWVKKYHERKQAGEEQIELLPESLEDE